VHRLNKVVIFSDRDGLCVREGGLQLAGQLVDSHVYFPQISANTMVPWVADIRLL
jgi:hypothetical protein